MSEKPENPADESKASKGGKARAEKLSPKERSEIAKKAARVRWETDIPRATHYGELHVGEVVIPCAVLEDGTRVLTQQGFLIAIGRSGKPAQGRGSKVEKMAPFLDLSNLKPFVSMELADSTKPIVFQVPSGTRAYGYKAELLPKVCEVYLQARDKDALLRSQLGMAKACEILMRALAHIGIVALVDEATGYQQDRARDALAVILENFIGKELTRWAKRFPDEFYAELYRLRSELDPDDLQKSNKMPQYVGQLTNNVVYKRLAPGVLDELKRVVPKDSKGRRKYQFHRRLTEDIGHPKLQTHLAKVVTTMQLSDDWDDFIQKLDRVAPVWSGDSIQKLLPGT